LVLIEGSRALGVEGRLWSAVGSEAPHRFFFGEQATGARVGKAPSSLSYAAAVQKRNARFDGTHQNAM
jgi:hypothetical protein